ncbi:hypothetical protein NQ317_012088 [Molorchus minor]|uniref:RNA helicase n=1 Tax=Molorchus minor TaxID=1323400 RepID=A0ABQ9JK18_9CUCU|nr:hypothetical protein NQ317_012088 [Molorchus minor]
MWKSILSYIWKADDLENELSLENACSILEEQPNINKDLSENLEKSYAVNNFSVRTGIITECNANIYLIDNSYTFTSDKNVFAVGSKIAYDYFICDNKENVTNVRLVESEWEQELNSDSQWNTRIIVCKVDRRTDRNLILSPGDVNIDLDNISIDFLPIVGDWLELDIKCSINENSIDLTGQIIEINKITPLRAHIETGTVTTWNSTGKNGSINRNIYFNKYSLSDGYIPVIGDKVVAEVIESDQNRCSWRALKVIPESITRCKGGSIRLDVPTEEVKSDYSGLSIQSPVLSFNKLNEKRAFSVTVVNKSENECVLTGAEFIKSNSQCIILEKIVIPKVIEKNMSHDIICTCISRNMGSSHEVLLLTFINFSIHKRIDINVTLNFKGVSTRFEQTSRISNQSSSNNELIRGQRMNAPPRFIAAKLPDYKVPQKLLETVSKYDRKDEIILVQDLKATKPSLFSNLSLTNYEDKFHTLLHLDEIANLILIRNYDQEKACFIPYEDFLMLEIENLSERRPSIVLGDKVIATDPLSRSQMDFEGIVHKVGAKHVFIKFSPIFHDSYNGEDYSIKIVPSRSSYRKLHHAVYLAIRNLGRDILFPTRVFEKEPQLSFTYDDSYSTSDLNNTDPSQKKKMTQSDILDRLIKINKKHNKSSDSKDKIENSADNVNPKFKLEWYNTNLNPKQKDAVVNVLLGTARPLPYIIFGPPGTGKTVTVIEIVLQIIRLIPHSRLLITAPSNSASDLIAMRLIQSGVLKPGDLVRLVSYNYALSDSIPISLVPYCATGSLAKDGTADINVTRSGIQFECSRAALGRHRITVATCSAAGQLYSMGFPKGHFSHIIVDEAAQASEPDVLIPLAFLDKSSGQALLAGDPMQLGPVVISQIAADYGLDESYLQRLCGTFPYSRDPDSFHNNSGYDPRLVTKLLYNYRSLPGILKLSSSLFYDDELIPTVKEIRSLLIEAEFDIPKIGTVEEFQGQEFDVIILSTVRSCSDYIPTDVLHSLGFVSSPRRLNVAISRPKSLLLVIGNPRLLCFDMYWRYVIKYCFERGSYVGCDFSL